jgi:hypothetical protein
LGEPSFVVDKATKAATSPLVGPLAKHAGVE